MKLRSMNIFNLIHCPWDKAIYGIGLFMINIVFAIDILVDWHMASGALYIFVLLFVMLAKKVNLLPFFAFISSAYIIFEVIVLSFRNNIVQSIIDHSISFLLIWVIVLIKDYLNHKKYFKRAECEQN